MAVRTETRIADALKARLAALAFSPALQIAWPNVAFTPPSGTYLRVDNLRNTTDRVLIGNDDPHRQQGILQVTVMAPAGGGETAAFEIAGQIADWFMAEPRLFFDGGSLRITKRPDIASLKDSDGSRWQVPVSIAWEAYI
jgi:hypothetical protein